MKKLALILPAFLLLVGCQPSASLEAEKHLTRQAESAPSDTKRLYSKKEWEEILIPKYQGKQPKFWGEKVPGVITTFETEQKVAAITLDACGGPNGDGYDYKLIETLRKEQIPATIFVNARWIEANKELFLDLAADPLFEIANHGTEHRPLSVNGKSIYGIQGTKDIHQIIDEVWENHLLITQLTGKEPQFFRSGTAYYDEIAVEIVQQLGEKVVHFDVVGDGGATFSSQQVYRAMMSVQPGSIVILHMNQPESGTAEGIEAAIPELKKRGFQFIQLEESLEKTTQ